MPQWNYNDTDLAIRIGASGSITYSRCIQRDDGRGGYNCEFRFQSSLEGGLARLHVHFSRGSLQVLVVRYFTHNGAEGRNIYVGDEAMSLASIVNRLIDRNQFPNHFLFFTHLRNAVQGIGGSGPHGELP